jgi:UDP-N-acetylmuramoyl-L-alanyl-D-glutamate--2,6-diaminopimelate ligase
MKKLNELLKTNLELEITNLNDDSRKIEKDGLFFAIKGLTNDGNKFIPQALKNGAVCIVTEEDIETEVPTIKVENAQQAYNDALNKFYDDVRTKLKFISTTGTDGKTTTSEMIYQILNKHQKCGYIGTNGIKCDDFNIENEHTTPFPDVLYKSLNDLEKKECKYISLECSSERLGTHKLDGIEFEAAVFTNLTRDHLDTHKTMENYAKAKAVSFQNLKKDGLGIVNYNDEYKKYFIEACNGKYVTYSIDNSEADLYASNIKMTYDVLEFDINGLYNKHIKTYVSGLFNVNNIMCAILVATHLGIDIDSVVDDVLELKPIASRQMLIKTEYGFNVMVDYAHTEGGITNLYNYVKRLVKGKIIGVYGSAGSRDPRRMINVANFMTENFDYIYFTIEDARYDDPKELIKLMVSETKKKNYELILDRDEAIKKAIMEAKEGDLILILGKGLEAYQVTNGELIPRPNDFESAKIALKEREKLTQKN